MGLGWEGLFIKLTKTALLLTWPSMKAEDQGGRMEVKSELGKGSKFTVSLPQKGLGK